MYNVIVDTAGVIVCGYGRYVFLYSNITSQNVDLHNHYTAINTVFLFQVTFYDYTVVLQAFVLTSAVFLGLTAYTFQSKRDFSKLGARYFSLSRQLGARTSHIRHNK